MILLGTIPASVDANVYIPKSQRWTIKSPHCNLWPPNLDADVSYFSSMQTNVTEQSINALHLDIDGFDVALDNCTTGHITFDKEDFIPGSYVEYTDSKSVEGVGGTTSAAGRGSVRWTLTDQDNQVHLLILHNVNYVPTSPLRLLSPQQLSYDLGDDKEKGTYITTYTSESVFVWHH
jgi:hypothetical protein